MVERNRIVEVIEVDADELTANSGNFKQHPDSQKRAFRGVIDEIGRAGALVAYHSERNGGELTLIDGHMRKDAGGTWTVLVTDLDDEEADKLLHVYDPISQLATFDQDLLNELHSRVKFSNQSVQLMIESMDNQSFESPLSALSGTMAEFAPNLSPTTSTDEITALDIANAQAAQDGKFADKIKAQKLLTCPHCGDDFYIKEDGDG